MSVDINGLNSGGEYFIKTKTARKFEARIVLSVVGPGEVLALTPAGDVALDDLTARGTKTFIRVDRDRPHGVPATATDFDIFPEPDELDDLYVKADQDRDELVGDREEARRAADAPESRFGYKRRPEGQDAGKLVAEDGVPAGDLSLGRLPGPHLSGGLGALSQALRGTMRLLHNQRLMLIVMPKTKMLGLCQSSMTSKARGGEISETEPMKSLTLSLLTGRYQGLRLLAGC